MNWYVRTNNFKTEIITAEVFSVKKNEMLALGIKKLVLYWLIAIFCILIPVLHFFLVPAFFIVGIYLLKKSLSFTHKILAGSFHCPECKNLQEIKNLPFNEETRISCLNCHTQLALVIS